MPSSGSLTTSGRRPSGRPVRDSWRSSTVPGGHGRFPLPMARSRASGWGRAADHDASPQFRWLRGWLCRVAVGPCPVDPERITLSRLVCRVVRPANTAFATVARLTRQPVLLAVAVGQRGWPASPTMSPDHSSKPAGSDPDCTLDCEEPDISSWTRSDSHLTDKAPTGRLRS
jgi:hypothetical protein